MKIALIGYGKMGKMIEKFALERNHQITWKIDLDNHNDIKKISRDNTDVAIEFTSPESVVENLSMLIKQGVNVVCGTTGWKSQLTQIQEMAIQQQVGFLWSSNFSIGVNLFFKLNQYLAKLMSNYPQYTPEIEEIHHIHKKDAPSGTAITLAEGILKYIPKYSHWSLNKQENESSLVIKAVREGEVPGTHIIQYNSSVDTIEITHKAKSREGFALGAVIAAEFIANKKGIFTMDDVLSL
ncbi:MAG: 4-hydroxy-tetrahydrodipicolinate reductase [Bacteroidales bacterium]|nr:4-hydroxy-tetrahydrodipicolinate reductase [Bacteroidales bacterium]